MIDVKRESHIATIQMTRPDKYNRLSTGTMGQICDTLRALNNEPDIHVVVITGTGKAFCAGADISEFKAETDAAAQRLQAKAFKDMCIALHEMKKPVVAKVNGIAVGGGMAMVSLSHIAIASSDARFGTPEIKVGAFPNMVMAAILRGLPKKLVLRMLMTGQMINAEQAEKMALINAVVAPEDLDAAVEKEVSKLLDKSPMVMSLGLDSIRVSGDMPYPQALEYLQEVNTIIRCTEDFREGTKAYLEKRDAVWKGR